jgi:cytochrome c
MSKNLENNKLLAALLLAGVLACMSGFVANIFYPVHHTAHIEEEEEVVEAAAPVVIDIPSLMAKADASLGEKFFIKCLSCHSSKSGEPAKTGPNLHGVYGKDIGNVAGYSYSEGMLAVAGSWDEQKLFDFLSNPKKYVKGTKMGFGGVKKPEELANLVAYLKTLK